MNTEEIFLLATTDLRARRSHAIQDAELNKLKAIRNEEYLKIANKLGALTIDIAKARFYKTGKASELEKEYEQAEAEEVKILSKMGMTRRDLEPHFHCEKCQDRGTIGDKYCDCYNELIAYYTNRYNLNALEEVSFASCDKLDPKLVDKMKEFTKSYPESRKTTSIFICGDIGVGKTQLTKAMATEFLRKGLYTIFTTATTLNKAFLDYHKCFNENKDLYLHHFMECDALFIDDLGTEPLLNNVTREYLLMLVSERIALRKLTVITSNLGHEEMAVRYGERLVSRLFDVNNSATFKIKGEDLRMRKTPKKSK